MPSFLNDENLPTFSPKLDVVDLASLDRFEYPDKELSDQQPVHHSPHTTQIAESLDERSTLSTRDSDTCGTGPAFLNGNSNGTRPTSMGSITNGVPTSDGETKRDLKGNSHAANGGLKHVVESNPIATAKDRNGASVNNDAGARNPKTSSEIADLPNSHSASLMDATSPISKLPESSSNGDVHANKARTASITPNPQTTELVPPPKSSPHRFSSPPAYQPGNAPLNSSPSGHLLPPGPPPTLKQRHTLEANKPAVGRTSKDGLDTAHATGRFSPTVAGSSNRRTSMNLGRKNTRSAVMDTPRDEVAPDEDALRWAEAYRQKRASKRRRKVEEDDERVLVGTEVDETHANWVTAYNMLTGIRVSVSRTNAKLDRELTDADFAAKQKSTFDITGNELVPSAKYDFKFKDYAPWVFRRLRALFRLDPADYLMSLTGKYILSELGSPGKSGSFFYFSRDYRYIIKTIHHAEHKFLRKILKDYYTHVENNPNTLLSQFYGLHRVKMPYGKKIHFIVMNNLFPPHRDIHATFDLKGSTIGRDYKEEDLEKNPRATLKDLNWLRRQRNLELGIQKKKLFLEQLQKDVVLLKRLQIMDYSLLVGIHDLSRGNEENLRDKTLQVFNPGGEKKSIDEEPQSALQRTPSKLETVRKARELREMISQERPIPMGEAVDKMPDELGEGHSRPGFVFNQDDGGFQATHENNAPADEIYYLGVIDCLTHYGMIKKIEHFWKGLSKDRTQISALPPEHYGDRFYNFVEGVTMSHEEVEREALRKEQEAAHARQSSEKPGGRSGKGKGMHSIPPMPTHQPPAPPSGKVSPSNEAKDTIARAEKQASKSDEKYGPGETQIPDRTLTCAPIPDARNGQHGPILPIVEEAGEGSKDENHGGKHAKLAAPTRAAPPVPSGQEHRFSRGSLDKDLPPLPGTAK